MIIPMTGAFLTRPLPNYELSRSLSLSLFAGRLGCLSKQLNTYIKCGISCSFIYRCGVHVGLPHQG